jgi:hypothetical protein
VEFVAAVWEGLDELSLHPAAKAAAANAKTKGVFMKTL